ncbi:MAG: DUF4351 domain-containing protein [Turicibacter sp.]
MNFHEDKAMKMIAQSLGEAVVAFLHIDKKIKEVGPTELTIPDAASMNMDYTYLMEDETYLHIEFQTTDKGIDDLRRFMLYDSKLAFDHKTDVYTCVIYSNDITTPSFEFQLGLSTYRVQPVSLGQFNAEDVFIQCEEKINNNLELTADDLLQLVWSPLMSGSKSKFEKLIKASQLLHVAPIKSTEQKHKLSYILLLFADKFLEPLEFNQLKEELSMAGFIKEVYNEGKLEGKSELIINQLTIKLCKMPEGYVQKIAQVSPKILDEIGNHIFEINKLEDLDQYLVQ